MGVEPYIALIAAIFGGVGLKVAETLLNKSKDKFDLAAQMRQELRDDVMVLREELEVIDNKLDEWRKKYFALLSAFNELSLIAKTRGMEDEVERIKKSLSH